MSHVRLGPLASSPSHIETLPPSHLFTICLESVQIAYYIRNFASYYKHSLFLNDWDRPSLHTPFYTFTFQYSKFNAFNTHSLVSRRRKPHCTLTVTHLSLNGRNHTSLWILLIHTHIRSSHHILPFRIETSAFLSFNSVIPLRHNVWTDSCYRHTSHRLGKISCRKIRAKRLSLLTNSRNAFFPRDQWLERCVQKMQDTGRTLLWSRAELHRTRSQISEGRFPCRLVSTRMQSIIQSVSPAP